MEEGNTVGKTAMIRALSVLLVCTAGLLAMTATTTAAGQGVDRIGPLAGASDDGGSCGNQWAHDTYSLLLTVKDNGDGTFNLRVDYKDGTFTTIEGRSPGACSSVNNHGTTLSGGVEGQMQGWLNETITSDSYDPNGCDNPDDCTTRTDAIVALFGAGAGQSDFTYNFEYHSSDKSLINRHWQDKSTGNDTGDVFVGDIATD
jgi:hypothetical protein